MNWIRNNPMLGAILLLVLPAVGAETYLVQRARQQAQLAQAALDLKKQERNRLARLSPAPSEANEQAIKSDLVAAGKILRSLQTAWLGEGVDGPATPAPAPVKSIEAYFDLAAFVERTRALAAGAQVQLKPAEDFGFKSYASEGPEPELVPAVIRQRVAVQHLVEALIEARPQTLLAVQREHPLTAGQRTARSRSGQTAASRTGPADGGGQAGDFFEMTGQISLRLPGQVDGEAYRLEFTGQTQNLRTFLNTLASSSLPIIVRSVEAEPLVTDAPGARPVSASAVTSMPLVSKSFSKFVVVVEYIVPVPALEESAP
jgi:hypothetical protein